MTDTALYGYVSFAVGLMWVAPPTAGWSRIVGTMVLWISVILVHNPLVAFYWLVTTVVVYGWHRYKTPWQSWPKPTPRQRCKCPTGFANHVYCNRCLYFYNKPQVTRRLRRWWA